MEEVTGVLPLPVVDGWISVEVSSGSEPNTVQGPPSKGQQEPRSVPVPQESMGGHMTWPVVPLQYFSPRALR